MADRVDGRLGIRLVLLLYGVFGLVTLARLVQTGGDMLMVNFLPYHRAAEALVAGEDLYAVVHPDAPAYPFLYPPITALAWVPTTPFDPAIGFAVQTLLSLGAGLAIAAVTWRLLAAHGVSLGRLDRGLLAWAAVGSSFAIPSLWFGNVNVILAGSLAIGLVAIERGRSLPAGVAIGLPGLLKAFPAVLGLWLVRLGDRRGTLAWLATGSFGLLVGAIAFGLATTETYLETALLPRTEPDRFLGGLPEQAGYVSLRQPIGVVLELDGALATAIAVAIVLPAVALAMATVDDLEGRLIAMLGLTAGTLLVLPSYYVYLVLLTPAMLPLAFLLRDRMVRRLYLLGMAMVAITLTPASISSAPGVLPAPVLDVAIAAMTVVRPPLVGLVVLLVAVALAGWQRRDDETRLASHL